MSENVQRSQGRGQGYKFDRGGMPAEFGPFIGVVKNNIDPTRAGRLQVYIEQFAGGDPSDASLWRTVSYIPPFYGSTPQSGTSAGTGTYVGNPNSYGMWFTPPDLETKVICFFVAGDAAQGYYIGCVPDPGLTHMTPAIGASNRWTPDNTGQESYFAGATQIPVTEINDENPAVFGNPRFFAQTKPVHSYVAGQMIQQGLIKDVLRGPITSSSQRESPSTVFGMSTPGRAIWQGGLTDEEVQSGLESGEIKGTDIRVVGRRGGHSIVMDDGNIQGYDNLIRIRSSKGHQITMSDDGDCFYIIHANGQSWLEFGSEGTVDVYSTNSVNIRTQGEINLHADKAINMYAGEAINIKSGKELKMQAVDVMELISTNKMNVYATNEISVQSDGSLALKNAAQGGWNCAGGLAFKGSPIDLNGPAPPNATKATPLKDFQLPDTKFVANTGWEVEDGALTTIVTRAPTHEPYPYHNRGVDAQVELADSAPEETATLPEGVTITRAS